MKKATAFAPSLEKATAFAPSTVANVAVGFDIMGFAFNEVGDRVTVRRIPEVEVRVEKMAGKGSEGIPLEAAKNTAGVALLAMLEDKGVQHGFAIEVEKGIPAGSGMGSSAASAVGAVVAANALLEEPLSKEKLLEYAVEGEHVASGARHADNVAPCLYGGLTLVLSHHPADIVQLPVPREVLCVVVNPGMKLETRTARAILKGSLLLAEHVRQSAYLGGFIAACYRGDIGMLQRSLIDVTIEPQRQALIPGFEKAKKAALREGALGFSISGAGPSVFAWTSSHESANRIERAIVAAFADSGLESSSWVSPISAEGARIVP